MFRLLLFISFLLSYFHSHSQNIIDEKKSLKYFLDIGLFKSEPEKQIFNALVAGKEPDYLSLYFISSPSGEKLMLENARSKIESFTVKSVPNKKGDYNSKELKKVYKEVHEEFFTKYIDNPPFNQVFIDGNYNCATASALFSILLDKLSISYNIRETPNHVYLIASPGNENIIFETTAPGARFLDVTDKVKEKYVEYLYENKLISKEEWQSVDKKKLFEQYFNTDDIINKRNLAGILYYNTGINALDKENYNDAYKYFERAFFLYPSNKIKYLVITTLANILASGSKIEDDNMYLYYLRFADLSKQEMAKKLLVEYIESITQKLLFKSPNPEKYRSLYKTIYSEVDDSSLLAELRYAHYYHSAHYYSIKNKFDSSLLYLDSVYAINREDLLVQELITETVQQVLRPLNNNEKTAIDSLDMFFKRYPFINKNGRFREMYIYCLSKVSSEYFQKDKKKEGETYLTILQETISKQQELLKSSEPYFTGALLEVYSYQIRHKQYKDAKAALLQLTKWYPESEEAKSRLKWVEQIIQDH